MDYKAEILLINDLVQLKKQNVAIANNMELIVTCLTQITDRLDRIEEQHDVNKVIEELSKHEIKFKLPETFGR